MYNNYIYANIIYIYSLSLFAVLFLHLICLIPYLLRNLYANIYYFYLIFCINLINFCYNIICFNYYITFRIEIIYKNSWIRDIDRLIPDVQLVVTKMKSLSYPLPLTGVSVVTKTPVHLEQSKQQWHRVDASLSFAW